jgi:hypothetical protein
MHFHLFRSSTAIRGRFAHLDNKSLRKHPHFRVLSRLEVASRQASQPQAEAHALSFCAKIAMASLYRIQNPLCKLAHS